MVCSPVIYVSDRKYKDISEYNRHMRVHFKIKPFKCHFCDHRSTTNEHRKRHMFKIHSDLMSEEERAKCAPGKSQFMVKPHSCPICTKGFTNTSNLKRHLLRTHPGTDTELAMGNRNRKRKKKESKIANSAPGNY